MALNKNNLKTEIKSILNELKNEQNQSEAIEKYAEKISAAVHNYVKNAKVRVTNGSHVYFGTLE